ncbi:MAG: NAD(P)H-dependent oxidoreductase subunit E [Dehalococcoidales bacterium]|jgi:NADH:ubiquinone oxidoreductase subunit E|nr:NAD(P)H-dependent oxidoreductase subunit E [Dehalococcoidales bacterium]
MLETNSAVRWEDRREYYREEIDKIVDANKDKAGGLIRILQQSQELVGYITPEMIEIISDKLGIPATKAYGVVSFYNYFTMVPKGKYIIRVCTGTACYVKGAQMILDAFDRKLGLKPDGITEDGLYSLETVRCLGACGLSPVMSINGNVHGRLQPNNIESILREYK